MAPEPITAERRLRPIRSWTVALTPEQAALTLGLSRRTFFDQLKSGGIGPRPVKFGRLRRFLRPEWDRWVEAGCPGRVRWDEQREGER